MDSPIVWILATALVTVLLTVLGWLVLSNKPKEKNKDKRK